MGRAAAIRGRASVARRNDLWRSFVFSRMLEFSMIADDRRTRLAQWLGAELHGARFTLTPASEDASFRRYFRATLDDGRSFVAIDALIRWQLATRAGELPPYDEALLRREMNLFPEWYVARHRRRTPRAEQS